MGNRDEIPSAIHRRILDAATRSVRRRGIRRTSLGDVAQLAGLSRGTIYLHFADKDALIQAVLKDQLRAFNDAGQQVVRKQKTLLKKVVEAIAWCTAELNSGLFLDLGETEPEAMAMLARDSAHLQEGMNFWPEHVRLAIESGELRSDIDVIKAADWITHIVMAAVMYPPPSLRSGSRKELRAFLESFLMQGLANPRTARMEC